jgi:hypothetical protein
MTTRLEPPARKWPLCRLCRKPIRGKVYYQGGQKDWPVHKGCLVVIKRSRDGGI